MRTAVGSAWLAVFLALPATSCDATFGDSGAQDGAPVPDAATATDADGDADATPRSDAAADAGRPCIEGDDQIQDPDSGACYMLFHTAATFAAAQSACQAIGGHLASLTSLAENELASTIAPTEPPLQDLWIGATDAGDEGTFAWLSGEPFAFANWRSGEPNDGGQNGEDCAILEGDAAVAGEGCPWDDRACNGSFPYLCER